MIQFIWHLRGSIELPPDISDAVAIDGVIAALRASNKRILEVTSQAVTFYHSTWFGGPRNVPLAFFYKGRLLIDRANEPARLRYDLNSFLGLVLCLFAVPFFSAFMLLTSVSPSGALKTGLLAFTWLYGANLVRAWFDVPQALRDAVSDARQRSQESEAT